MQVEVIKSRYNLKTGQREQEDYLGSRKIDECYRHNKNVHFRRRKLSRYDIIFAW